MAFVSSFEDRPLSRFRGFPIYVTTILTLASVVGVILTAILSEGNQFLLSQLIFLSRDAVVNLHIWQFATATFISQPNFFTLFGLAFFYFWGLEIEKYLGRNRFITLIAIVSITPMIFRVALMLLKNLMFHTQGQPLENYPYFGSAMMSAGIVVAFCTLYPNLQYFGMLAMKWVGVASYLIGAVTFTTRHDWFSFFDLSLVCLGAFTYVRALQHGVELPRFSHHLFSRRWPRLRVVRPPVPGKTVRKHPRSNESLEIDQLLEKISRHGLSSLTARERQALEQARARLLEKDDR